MKRLTLSSLCSPCCPASWGSPASAAHVAGVRDVGNRAIRLSRLINCFWKAKLVTERWGLKHSSVTTEIKLLPITQTIPEQVSKEGEKGHGKERAEKPPSPNAAAPQYDQKLGRKISVFLFESRVLKTLWSVWWAPKRGKWLLTVTQLEVPVLWTGNTGPLGRSMRPLGMMLLRFPAGLLLLLHRVILQI